MICLLQELLEWYLWWKRNLPRMTMRRQKIQMNIDFQPQSRQAPAKVNVYILYSGTIYSFIPHNLQFDTSFQIFNCARQPSTVAMREKKPCWAAICWKAFKPDRAHFCRAMGRVVGELRSQWATWPGPWVIVVQPVIAPFYTENFVIEDSSQKYMEPDQTKHVETSTKMDGSVPKFIATLLFSRHQKTPPQNGSGWWLPLSRQRHGR